MFEVTLTKKKYPGVLRHIKALFWSVTTLYMENYTLSCIFMGTETSEKEECKLGHLLLHLGKNGECNFKIFLIM